MNPQQGEDLGVAQPWMPPPQPAPRRPRFSWTALGAAVLAAAALVVSIIALGQSRTTATSSSPAPLTPSTSPASGKDTTAADRALCEAVGPLLRERASAGKAFVNTGETGTEARDAAIPGFRQTMEDWSGRIQPILDRSLDAQAFLRRTLQRLTDDTRLYVESIRPGPGNDFDKLAWDDGVVAYGGPYYICHQLGVTW